MTPFHGRGRAGLKIATHGFAFFRARLLLIRKQIPFLPPALVGGRGRSRYSEDFFNPYINLPCEFSDSEKQKNNVRQYSDTPSVSLSQTAGT